MRQKFKTAAHPDAHISLTWLSESKIGKKSEIKMKPSWSYDSDEKRIEGSPGLTKKIRFSKRVFIARFPGFYVPFSPGKCTFSPKPYPNPHARKKSNLHYSTLAEAERMHLSMRKMIDFQGARKSLVACFGSSKR